MLFSIGVERVGETDFSKNVGKCSCFYKFSGFSLAVGGKFFANFVNSSGVVPAFSFILIASNLLLPLFGTYSSYSY